MKLCWTKRALADLDEVGAWLATIEYGDPKRTITRIRDSATQMERLGDIGRPSRAAGQRELSVRKAPYILHIVSMAA